MTPTLPLTILLLAAISSRGEEPVSFRREVAPILVKHCLGCHNDQKAKSGLNLKTFSLLKKGGKSNGAAILAPGDPDASGLVESIRPDAQPRMPDMADPLSDAQIALIERWVREGATFDGASESDTLLASMVDPLAGLKRIRPRVVTSEPVTAAAVSPDGKLVAAIVGQSVTVFDLASGKPPEGLDGKNGPLTSVAFSPDGTKIVAAGGRAGQFGAFTAWERTDAAKRLDVRGHADSILAAAVSPDGAMLATASYDRLVRLWNLSTGAEIRTFKEHTDSVHAVAFSPDGKSLATGSADRTVKLWDVATGRRKITLGDSTAEVYSVAFSPDGDSVYAAGADRSIRRWAIQGDGAKLARSVVAHDAAVIRLALSKLGPTLYSSGEDRTIRRWEAATLRPLSSIEGQPDWVMGLAVVPDGTKVVVGRYDGSLELLDAVDGRILSTLRKAPEPTPTPKPKLATKATLNPLSPRGGTRGTTLRLSLSGNGVGSARSIIFPELGLSARILPREKSDPNALDVDLTVAPDARIGIHRLFVLTDLGSTPEQPFAVSAESESTEQEPNDAAPDAKSLPMAPVVSGTIDRPGDVDLYRFTANIHRPVVFEMQARSIGSPLSGLLEIFDEGGLPVASARGSTSSPDPLLVARLSTGGYRLRVADGDFGGSANHVYRIRGGTIPVVAGVFPRAVPKGGRAVVLLSGENLRTAASATVEARGEEILRSLVTPPVPDGSINGHRLVVVEGEIDQEKDADNDRPDNAQVIEAAGGVSGTIRRSGDVDHYRFRREPERPHIVEVYGRRLNSPIDPAIEILDPEGRPMPLAVLRTVAESSVAFRDHGSAGRSLRMTVWDDFAERDHLLIGRELTRLAELPRNPDDDALLWGTGRPRGGDGERIGLLGTTPEHHPLGQPIRKVEIHPPGSTFPRGSVPPVTLFHRNDDGGPGLGKDSMLGYTTDSTGDLIVRVEDMRGFGGDEFQYHLVVREPRPDFELSIVQENPNIPRGGTTLVQVNASRRDGFEGPIDLHVEGLPRGVTAEATRIEPEAFTASLLLAAAETAESSSTPTWTLIGSSTIPGRGDVMHRLDPGGPRSGYVSIAPEPNLKVTPDAAKVTIRPGERIELGLSVDRSEAFAGRVPIEVRNLPRGCAFLNIGLNGVLVREKEVDRSIFLYAEPWAEPTVRAFFAVGQCEAAGTEHASPPIELTVEPPKLAPGPR